MSITEAEVFGQAVDQAGFLWCQRASAVRDPRYTLKDLAELDARLAAQMALLRRGGKTGFALAVDAAGEGGAGEVFAALVLALARHDREGMAPLLAQGMEAPEVARGVVSALGWASAEEVREVLPGLLAAEALPALQAMGIAACAVRRRDPGAGLGQAMRAEEPRLRARALRAVGELGYEERLAEVRPALGAEDAGVRLWGAWSAALLGDRGGVDALLEIAAAGGAAGERAVTVAMPRLGALAGVRWVRRLPEAGPAARVAVVAAGALGDPALVPWLLERLRAPKLARCAGAALTLITGVDLVKEKLEGAALEETGPSDAPEDEDVSVDGDEGWPWPDAAAVERWWARRRSDFAAGRRHVLGKPVELAWVQEVLRVGTQPARQAAAVERCIARPRQGLFEVRARGDRQRAELGEK
ncbi:HEAT repeat protein [Chondromyces apiculatus DSM 436]|uniref:HEAT repeat protein n=1 Tax=Chondromyces apiculatus DSM 436 TaxID=1192034 RepID=A0A017T1Z4_9BACT|nr:HEAT repeat protein [Chondromyces apiculatus DSM 436]